MDKKEWINHLNQWKTFLVQLNNVVDDSEKIKINRQLDSIDSVRCAAVQTPKLLSEFISPSEHIRDDCNELVPYLSLNESQLKAVKYALSDNVLTIIQGPPGTGKTQVISEICLQLFKENPEIKILVCSETHIAVNNIIQRVSELNNKMRILRIQDKENVESIEKYSPENILKAYFRWIDNSIDEQWIKNIVFENINPSNAYKVEKELALSANIVGMTCNKSGSFIRNDRFVNSVECFDYAIIDEVCKANLPEILMPLIISKNAVLVGDPQQLPPVFCSEEIDVIKSIDDCKLQQFMYVDKLFEESKQKVMLDVQYRMTRKIGDLIGNIFYDGKLKNGRNDDRENALIWVSYSPCEDWPPKSEKSQKKPRVYNNEESEFILKILVMLDKTTEKKEVAVIAPYKQQVIDIRKKVNQYSFNSIHVNVDTVDGFQGKETDTVVFGVTRTYGTYRFLADRRRLNVALSRAKNKIIIVGSENYSNKNALLRIIKQSCEIRTIETIEEII